MKTKICNKCGEKKSVDDFHNDKKNKSGKKDWCKKCGIQKSKQYRENNKEKIKQYNKQYRENNKKKIKQYNKYHSKQYQQQNKEKIKKRKKEWFKKQSLNLTNIYISNLLQMPKKELKKYPELIKLKRIQIKILRELQT